MHMVAVALGKLTHVGVPANSFGPECSDLVKIQYSQLTLNVG